LRITPKKPTRLTKCKRFARGKQTFRAVRD
jgi:hypothetical protein